MEATISKERASAMPNFNAKRMRISDKRQLTIPKNFFDQAGFGKEAMVEFDSVGKRLIVKPISESDGFDFSDEILKDLIERGFEGQELLEEFKNVKTQIPEALKRVFDEKIKEKSQVPIMSSDMSLDEYLDQFPDDDEDD